MKTNGIKINGTIIEMDLSGFGPQEKIVFSNNDDTVLELSIDHNRNIQINEVDKEFPYSPYGDYENKENGDKGTVNAKFPPRSNGATEAGKSYISNLLRINECYFGGNVRLNNKAAATHNFVELANATDYNLSLNGLHLLYIPQDPTDNTWRHIALKGYIPAHGTYLIKGAKCGTPSNRTLNIGKADIEWYEDGELIKFHENGGAFYLALGDSDGKIYDAGPSTWVTPTLLSATTPYQATVIPGYIDLCGIYASGVTAKFAEGGKALSIPSLQECIPFRTYGLDPGSASVLKVYSKRATSTFWTYCNMNKVGTDAFPYFSEEMKSKLLPKASFESRDYASMRTTFSTNKPNCPNITFGIQATDGGSTKRATRCFNWVSVGYEDEFVEYRQVGSNTWTRKYSIATDGGHIYSSEYAGDATISTFIAVYDRQRWTTIGGVQVTTHKAIVRGLTAGTYEYRIGRNESFITEPITFKVLADSDISTFSFVHTSDQQGFSYNEYQAWAKSVYAITQAHNNFDFTINTGDISQSGNREFEWLDYYNGKKLFNGIVEMPCIGNNDLCGRYLDTLNDGTTVDGVEHTKVNGSTMWLYYNIELDVNNTVYMEYQPTGVFDASKVGPLALRVDSSVITYFIPSMYSFNFGKYHFIALNSEMVTNLASTYLYYNDNTKTSEFQGNVYYNIFKWLEKDFSLYGANDQRSDIRTLMYCHEIPFCIVPVKGDDDASAKDRTNGNGSKLNIDFSAYISTAPTIYSADYTSYGGDPTAKYIGGECVSEFLQVRDIRLCFGGHKHTYSLSHPVKENVTYSGNTRLVQPNSPVISTLTPSDGVVTTSTANYVTYAMTQATGYKLTSNNDRPGQNIPWLFKYFPATKPATGNVENSTAQQFPMYNFITCGTSETTVFPRIINGVTILQNNKITLFNINSQIASGPSSTGITTDGENPKPIKYIIQYA